MAEQITADLLVQSEYILRVLVSALCGLAIGLERRGRMKSAGPRTHLFVALASALMMIISKYGFNDVLLIEGMKIDASRVAASIITGITFLGAGLIFVRKREVNGVNTAACLWATVGVGMAIGAGMYLIGIAVCVIVILLQLLLHSPLRIFREAWVAEIEIKLDTQRCSFASFNTLLQKQGVEIMVPHIKRESETSIELKFDALFAPHMTHDAAVAFLEQIDGVTQVKF